MFVLHLPKNVALFLCITHITHRSVQEGKPCSAALLFFLVFPLFYSVLVFLCGVFPYLNRWSKEGVVCCSYCKALWDQSLILIKFTWLHIGNRGGHSAWVGGCFGILCFWFIHSKQFISHFMQNLADFQRYSQVFVMSVCNKSITFTDSSPSSAWWRQAGWKPLRCTARHVEKRCTKRCVCIL